MKRPIIIILLIAAAACILIGAAGLVGNSHGGKEEDKPINRELHPDTHANQCAASPADLLDVASGDPVSVVKNYEGFRVAFNARNHTPDWVAWELLGSETEGSESRSNKFWSDPELEGCPLPADYRNSGYDRGHMCPAGDQKWSREAMHDCFVMANMCPQDHSLNTGAWNTLENKERTWAKRDSAIVIVAGPIYENTDTITIGENGVRVPGAFFKVIAAPYLQEPRAIAFIFPNMSAPGNMQQYVMSVDEVEKLTGLDFFHNLPDEIENRIESASSFVEWNRKHN